MADQRKAPRYDSCNAARLGRIAVDLHFRSQKLGTLLVIDLLDRLKGQRDLPVSIVYVDAYPAAEGFYQKFLFRRTLDPINDGAANTIPMYLPLRRFDEAINVAQALLVS